MLDHARSRRPSTDAQVLRAAGMLTLADVHPGDTVEPFAVPADVRDLLDGFGVRVGARLRCESARQYVVVRTENGSVPFERGLAATVPVILVASVEPSAAVD